MNRNYLKSETFRKNLTHPAVIGVSIVRIISAFLFFSDPLWGWLVYLVLDTLDGQIVVHLLGMTPHFYHTWDKFVDFIVFLFMLFAAWKSEVFLLLSLLLIYRLTGQILYWQTGNERVTLWFPNVFEVVWLWFVVGGSELHFIYNLSLVEWIFGIGGLIIIKEMQEMLLHWWGPGWIFPYLRTKIARVFPWYVRATLGEKN